MRKEGAVPVRFVIDNSVVISWCFEDEWNRYSGAVLESLSKREALVPAIWPLEAGNALLVAERKKRLSQASVMHFLDLLHDLPISVDQETPDRMLREIISLARMHNLSTYDASYLDLAIRQGLPIATLDSNLLKAAKKSKIRIYEPSN